MINILEEYIWRSLPEYGDFITRPTLEMKVDQNGRILPYYGNTTVFLLEEKTKEQLGYLQEELYQGAGEMLAERLTQDSFHMTLHDLVNGPVKDAQLEEKMCRASQEADGIIRQWKDIPPLHMKATWMFNMVNTSIVLGLSPADEYSWQKLDEMYCALEQVVPLGYGLTPHITLAYFKPGAYGREVLEKLNGVLRKVDLEVTLQAEDLVLQNFVDMNHYDFAAMQENSK